MGLGTDDKVDYACRAVRKDARSVVRIGTARPQADLERAIRTPGDSAAACKTQRCDREDRSARKDHWTSDVITATTSGMEK